MPVMTPEMTPELLVQLTPEQREAWERCQKVTHAQNCPAGWKNVPLTKTCICGSGDLPAPLLELAKAKLELVARQDALNAALDTLDAVEDALTIAGVWANVECEADTFGSAIEVLAAIPADLNTELAQTKQAWAALDSTHTKALLSLAEANDALAELRAAVDAASHGHCHKQTEPHCAHCRKVRGTHYWGSKWGKDGTCRDDRGRPEPTEWTPVEPLPCDCWKSRVPKC